MEVVSGGCSGGPCVSALSCRSRLKKLPPYSDCEQKWEMSTTQKSRFWTIPFCSLELIAWLFETSFKLLQREVLLRWQLKESALSFQIIPTYTCSQTTHNHVIVRLAKREYLVSCYHWSLHLPKMDRSWVRGSIYCDQWKFKLTQKRGCAVFILASRVDFLFLSTRFFLHTI